MLARSKELVRVCTLVPPADGATGRVGGDPLLPHQLREVLAPFAQRRLVNAEPLAEFILSFDDQGGRVDAVDASVNFARSNRCEGHGL